MPRDYKPDWVKSSSLSLIPRGLQWFKEFGLEEGVKSIAAEYDRKTINVVDFKTVGCCHRRPIPALLSPSSCALLTKWPLLVVISHND